MDENLGNATLSQGQWIARAVRLGLDDKEWLRTPEAIKYCGLGRARLYELLLTGEIKAFLLKPHRNALQGRRMWSRSSIDAYLQARYEEALASGNPMGVVSWAKEKAEFSERKTAKK